MNTTTNHWPMRVCGVLAVLAGLPHSLTADDYTPLMTTGEPPAAMDLTIQDRQRDRAIPIRVYRPADKPAAPVILFSHGLGGSRRACGYACQHWAARGFVVIAMQHAGSDESVWQDVPLRQRLQAMKNATTFQNALARFQDVRFVLDQLAIWQDTPDHPLHERLDLDRVGMSGHSFGAATTQGVSGQSAPRIGQRFTDARIDAAVMFSPSLSQRASPEEAFGKVRIPWMLMTGTRDTSVVSSTTVADRRSVYPALPKTIDRYELVLHDGEHHAFNDGKDSRKKRNPNHHRVILALSTAFWDAHLKDDKSARDWLHGPAPRETMDSKDSWQFAAAEKAPQTNPRLSRQPEGSPP